MSLYHRILLIASVGITVSLAGTLYYLEGTRQREAGAEHDITAIGATVDRTKVTWWLPERYSSRITSLDLSGVEAEWVGHAPRLAKDCTCLSSISIHNRQLDIDEARCILTFPCNELSLAACTIPVQGWQSLASSQVEALNLSSVYGFGDRELQEVAATPSLRKLDVSATDISNQGLAQLARCQPLLLERICLTHTQIGDEGVGALAAIQTLRYIDLSETQVSDGVFAHLSRLHCLEHLLLKGNAITGSRLCDLAPCQTIRTLSLSKAAVGGGRLPRPSDIRAPIDIEALLEAPGAQTLGLLELPERTKGERRAAGENSDWYDLDLSQFPCLSNLHYLDLSGTSLLDQSGLARLRHCPNLRVLNLTDTNVNDTGIAAIADHPKLEQLYLDRTQVSGAVLALLMQCNALRYVSVSGTEISEVELRKYKGGAIKFVKDDGQGDCIIIHYPSKTCSR